MRSLKKKNNNEKSTMNMTGGAYLNFCIRLILQPHSLGCLWDGISENFGIERGVCSCNELLPDMNLIDEGLGLRSFV